jgi:hypothetical protein
MDVLAAADGSDYVIWYENLGNGFTGGTVITWNISGAACVFSADLDGDGDEDVISASTYDNMIAWFENIM